MRFSRAGPRRPRGRRGVPPCRSCPRSHRNGPASSPPCAGPSGPHRPCSGCAAFPSTDPQAPVATRSPATGRSHDGDHQAARAARPRCAGVQLLRRDAASEDPDQRRPPRPPDRPAEAPGRQGLVSAMQRRQAPESLPPRTVRVRPTVRRRTGGRPRPRSDPAPLLADRVQHGATVIHPSRRCPRAAPDDLCATPGDGWRTQREQHNQGGKSQGGRRTASSPPCAVPSGPPWPR